MTGIQVVQTTQQIIVNPSTNAVTVVNAGPVGPIGPTAIYVGPTPPSNTTLLWVQTL
jgi:hypothetical protein